MSLVTAAAAALAVSMTVISPAAAAPSATADPSPNPTAFVLERFRPASAAQGDRGAVTYDSALVPTTAVALVAELRITHGKWHGQMRDHDMREQQGEREKHGMPPRGTFVFLALRGVDPDHHFGIHVHTRSCGTKPDSSGPHYQNMEDPEQPSTNPKYANPRNEMWLDLTTNSRGDGRAKSLVKWHFRPGEARSVVIHEHGTATHMGRAGVAGDRVACINVPFK
ncbi:superoxide dismutase family protein [Streptomyces sp. RTd22]|uniref:superoxide dismutase family protein n=1 Tax=Streptomyces sp. RTd22 TaxID=1841249 RepID=UPI000B214B72|nr:superoxide dismutase family protein [Streptomyces sp. RTd22]